MEVVRYGLLRTTGRSPWKMVMKMPDPRKVGEYGEKKGAYFIGLHDLVQLKMAVYLSKLKEHGPATAAKDLGDVQGLMKNNLAKLSREVRDLQGLPCYYCRHSIVGAEWWRLVDSRAGLIDLT
jgi:hypothetical protein